MPQQSNLFSSSPPSGSTVQERQPAPQRPSRLPLWLRRVELYLYVIIRIYIGVIVLVLPWYAPLWADNQLLNHFPRLATFLMYGAVRGIVSGPRAAESVDRDRRSRALPRIHLLKA